MKHAFFFHYNKPASQAAKAPRLSIHYRGACHIVDGVECQVPIRSRNRKTQPRCVMAGRAGSVTVTNGQAVIR